MTRLGDESGRPPGTLPGVRVRLRLLATIAAFAFVGLLARLWYLQVVNGNRYYDASFHFLKTILLQAPRGLILDRAGVVLAENRASFAVEITPAESSPAAIDALADYLDLPVTEVRAIREKIEKARWFARYQPQRVIEDLDRDAVGLLEQNREALPGVHIVEVPLRAYPQGTIAAHLLGYLNQVTAEELAAWPDQGYHPGDDVGRTGIERQWEGALHGRTGRRQVVVDAHGREVPPEDVGDLLSSLPGTAQVDPVAGDNLVLTIDARLQRAAERALRAHLAGGIVAVDVHTGRILAMASRPSFDPNVLTGHVTLAEIQALDADPLHPLLDRTVREDYFPGSTFKVVPALAGLEDKAISPGDIVVCHGEERVGNRIFRCDGTHGPVDLVSAITQSCDIYFWHLGQKVGIDRMAEVAGAFGLGKTTGLGLNGEVAGFLPTKAWYESHGGFKIGYSLNTAIGQGAVKVTVLQMAMLYAALANGGTLYAPQLVLRRESPIGALLAEFPPVVRGRLPVSPASLSVVLQGLRGVVANPKGTAYGARLLDLVVAGKTGTAQVRRLKLSGGPEGSAGAEHAWFCGFAPADAPEIATCVLVEHGGVGGKVAAPVAMQVLEAWMQIAHGTPASRPAGASRANAASIRDATGRSAPAL